MIALGRMDPPIVTEKRLQPPTSRLHTAQEKSRCPTEEEAAAALGAEGGEAA